jgi:4-hydroxy-tetrahydrodipicolinate synthase
MKPILGSIVALVTPMQEDGSVDYVALRRLIDWHIAEGTDCIGVVGTTGESPTVTVEEHCEVIRVSVEHAKGRVPIMAGTGGNSTAEAIELSRFAQQVGADCTLSVVPYYNKPSQEGIYQHFKKIAEAVDVPMVLYNVPGRTVADMQVETALRLAQVPGIVGIKEASGQIDRAAWLIKQPPTGFSIYSGDCSSNRAPRPPSGPWPGWASAARPCACRSRRSPPPVRRWSNRRCATRAFFEIARLSRRAAAPV